MSSSLPDVGRGAGPDPIVTDTPFRRFVRRLCHQRLALMALTILTTFVLVAIFAPLLVPMDPAVQNLAARNLPPGAADHVLGTDDLGRDQLSRLIDGTRITLLAPLIAVGIGLVLGLPSGLVAGYFGGWPDGLLSRVSDAMFSVPALVLAMAVVAVRGQSTVNAMSAVGVMFAPRIFRVVRAAALSVRHEPFVDAARTIGVRQRKIITTHVLPNVTGPLFVQCTVLLGLGVLFEAGLSFLGIGVRPPDASWGVILRRAFDNIYAEPLASIAPGLLITTLILAFQFLGDGIRDSLGKETRRDA